MALPFGPSPPTHSRLLGDGFPLGGAQGFGPSLAALRASELPRADGSGGLAGGLVGSGLSSNVSPMACSTTRLAIVVKSCGVPVRVGLLERLGMP